MNSNKKISLCQKILFGGLTASVVVAGITTCTVLNNTSTNKVVKTTNSVTTNDTTLSADASSFFTTNDQAGVTGTIYYQQTTVTNGTNETYQISIVSGNGTDFTSLTGKDLFMRDCLGGGSDFPIVGIGANAFTSGGSRTNNLQGTLDLSYCDKLQTIGDSAFANNANLTAINLSSDQEKSISGCDSLQTIGASAFNGTQITNFDLTSCASLSSMASSFDGNTNIKSIQLPRTLQSIGQDTFNTCTSLEYVDLNNCILSTIGANAFAGCSSLIGESESNQMFVFPDSVTTIGTDIFSGCSKLTTLKFTRTEATWLNDTEKVNSSWLTGSSITSMLVPKEQYDAYNSVITTRWSTYTGAITPYTPEKANSTNLGMIIGLTIGLIAPAAVAIGLGVYFILWEQGKKGSKKKKQKQENLQAKTK